MAGVRGRSERQRAMQMANLAKSSRYRSSADKENVDAQPRSTVHNASTSSTKVVELKARGDKFQKQLKVARQSNRRLVSANKGLKEEIKVVKDKHTLIPTSTTPHDLKSQKPLTITPQVDIRAELERVTSQLRELQQRHEEMMKGKDRLRHRDRRTAANLEKAVQREVAKAAEAEHTVHLKDHRGCVTNNTRLLVQDLIEQGVPVKNVPDTIKISAARFGLHLNGDISSRSVGRIAVEGLVASKLKVASELHSASDITISCDGTSHLNTQYESKHVTFMLPGESTPVTRTLGISSAPNHTSEEQLNGWKNDFTELCGLLNKLPSRASLPPISVDDLAVKIRGMGSDHAEDQKKLAKLLRTWKIDADRFLRGKAVLCMMETPELTCMYAEESEKLVAEVGGQDAWEQLPDNDIDAKQAEAFRMLCTRLGNEAFAKLDHATQEAIDKFIWGGCCGHKEANAVKYGDTHMRAAWSKGGLQGPIALPNKFTRDGLSATTSNPPEPSAGAVKVASLAGAIFNNKDDKKGQHNTVRQFFEQRLGYQLRFPDTSNTRFQSYCRAAEELLVHLDLYREFMALVKDGKEKRTFTNIERNVNDALSDGATLTELAVLALYSQAVSHPYMAAVRGQTLTALNLLDLGPLHDKVIDFCRSIIAEPELLIAPDVSCKSATLDGEQWQRPEAVYKVHYLIQNAQVPHIRDLLLAFFKGALEGWIKFSAEFSTGGTIDSTSTDERTRIFIHATNDLNEGALGAFRVALRRRPNMSLHQFNARALYKTNQTADFINSLSPQDQQYLRQTARELDASGLERKRRISLADAYAEIVAIKRAKVKAREAKRAEVNAKLDKVSLRLDVAEVEGNPGKITVTQLMEQLDWHRRHDMACFKKTALEGKTHVAKMKKPNKIAEWKKAVERYLNHQLSCALASPSIPLYAPADTVNNDYEMAGGPQQYDRYGEDSDDEL